MKDAEPGYLLSKYIADHYGGNKALFAKEVGKSKQLIGHYVSAGYCIEDGKLVSPSKEILKLPKIKTRLT